MQNADDIMNNSNVLRLVKDRKRPIVVDSVAPAPQVPAKVTQKQSYPICPTCGCEMTGVKRWVKSYSDLGDKHFGYKEVPCPTCSADADALKEARERAALIEKLFHGSQIPWHARTWEFNTFPADADKAALNAVQEFVQRHLDGDEYSKRGLYIGGPAGRCKTSLAISALKVAMRAGHSGLFIMTMELMDKLRATFGKEQSVSQDQILDAVNSVTWLVLDDLAVERPSPYVIEKMYFIIEKRRSQGLYTIITSNLNTSKLEEYWRPDGVAEGAFHPGIRVVERIREYCDGCMMRGRNQRGADW